MNYPHSLHHRSRWRADPAGSKFSSEPTAEPSAVPQSAEWTGVVLVLRMRTRLIYFTMRWPLSIGVFLALALACLIRAWAYGGF